MSILDTSKFESYITKLTYFTIPTSLTICIRKIQPRLRKLGPKVVLAFDLQYSNQKLKPIGANFFQERIIKFSPEYRIQMLIANSVSVGRNMWKIHFSVEVCNMTFVQGTSRKLTKTFT